MTTIELLKSHPLSTEVIKDWFWKEMLKSFDDDAVPEDFKQMMLSDGIPDENLAKLIDAQPRVLFDVFDENRLYINITRCMNKNEEWGWEIVPASYENAVCPSRKVAEECAIQAALLFLEVKLSPKDVEEITTTITPEEND